MMSYMDRIYIFFCIFYIRIGICGVYCCILCICNGSVYIFRHIWGICIGIGLLDLRTLGIYSRKRNMRSHIWGMYTGNRYLIFDNPHTRH